jgi:hypothetical protein
MVKKFTANCDFGGQKAPVTFYIGNPATGSHPLGFQNKWLSTTKGGFVPPDIMESFSKLAEISVKNRVPFEDLCAYVIEELNSANSLSADAKQASALSSEQKPSEQKISEDKK